MSIEFGSAWDQLKRLAPDLNVGEAMFGQPRNPSPMGYQVGDKLFDDGKSCTLVLIGESECFGRINYENGKSDIVRLDHLSTTP